MRRLVIAAPHSGSGKTTLTLGLMAALRRRGLRVAPFKVGPDFIDPGYHRLASGAVSVNLDGWMCDLDFVRETFARHTEGADVAVVEGVMGLFDGMGGVGEAGSSAEVAKVLDAPVVLVLDARGQARSAAALLHGFVSFDKAVRIAGVIFNNVASANHERILREAVEENLPDLKVIGCVPKDPELVIPSRHLGLLTVEDNPLSEEFLGHLVDVIERHLDIEALLGEQAADGGRVVAGELGEAAGGVGEAAGGLGEAADGVENGGFPLAPSRKGRGNGCATGPVRIGVARDAAFCFVYQDNLRLLSNAGAELCFFSPLTDNVLPDGIAGIYLPGGYPELFAPALAANDALKGAMRDAVESGMPVYAECGGFIYLTRGVREDDVIHPFAGVFPVLTHMLPRRKALGYRQIELSADGVIGAKGMVARGHEFHYSEMEEMPKDVERIYSVSRNRVALGSEGYRYKNCLASYIHLHFGSSPGIAGNFVGQCRAYMERSLT